jgi:chromate transporter
MIKKVLYYSLFQKEIKWCIMNIEVQDRGCCDMTNNEQSKASVLGEIFWSFCKISPISFGGGYAMIPAIEKEVVEKRQWMDEDEISGALSIAASAPGGIGVNAATIIGYRVAGIQGAIAAVAGIGLPNFFIMMALTISYVAVEGSVKASAAFEGIHMAVVAFIAVAGWRMLKSAVHDKSTLVIAAGALAALLFTSLHPALLLLFGTLAGVWIFKMKEKLQGVSVQLKNSGRSVPGSAPVLTGQYMWGDGI